MAVRLIRFESGLAELRYAPTAKHVRTMLAGETVADSQRAVLVWEPQRVEPQYALPADDVVAELVPGQSGAARHMAGRSEWAQKRSRC